MGTCESKMDCLTRNNSEIEVKGKAERPNKGLGFKSLHNQSSSNHHTQSNQKLLDLADPKATQTSQNQSQNPPTTKNSQSNSRAYLHSNSPSKSSNSPYPQQGQNQAQGKQHSLKDGQRAQYSSNQAQGAKKQTPNNVDLDFRNDTLGQIHETQERQDTEFLLNEAILRSYPDSEEKTSDVLVTQKSDRPYLYDTNLNSNRDIIDSDRPQYDHMMHEIQKELQNLDQINAAFQLENLIETIDETFIQWEFKKSLSLIQKAQKRFNNALPQVRNSDDSKDLVGSYITIKQRNALVLIENGIMESKKEYFSQALVPLQEAIEFHNSELKSEDTPSLAGCYSCLGYCYLLLENVEKALQYLNKGLEIRETLIDKNDEYYEFAISCSYLKLGLAFSKQKNFENAFNYAQKGLEMRKKEQNLLISAYSLYVMAEIYYEKRDYVKAFEHYFEAKEKFKAYSLFGMGDETEEAYTRESLIGDIFDIFYQDEEFWKSFIFPKVCLKLVKCLRHCKKSAEEQQEYIELAHTVCDKLNEDQIEKFFEKHLASNSDFVETS